VLVPFVVVFEGTPAEAVDLAELVALELDLEAVAPSTVVALVTVPADAVDTVAFSLTEELEAVIGRVETFAVVVVGVAVVTGTTVTTVVVVVAVVLAVDARVVVEVVVEAVDSGGLLADEMGLTQAAVEDVRSEGGDEGVESVEDGGEVEDGIAVDSGAVEMTVLEEEVLAGALEMVKAAVSLVMPACTISRV